jgi:hypothetical protein
VDLHYATAVPDPEGAGIFSVMKPLPKVSAALGRSINLLKAR